MSTILIPVPKFRAFDNDGAPLAGGLVYTYEAGTSTPLATYTDYSGLTANTNPVVLDAAGYADIWLDNALYKIVLEDANGVVIYTEDNIGTITGTSSTTNPFGAATDIPSGTQVDMGTVSSHFANITGTSGPIISFGSTATLDAPIYLAKTDNIVTIQNNADIITRLGADIITAPNDHFWLEYLGSGVWKIFDYIRNDGSIDATTINCATINVTTTANLP